jgi:hypothetical protein
VRLCTFQVPIQVAGEGCGAWGAVSSRGAPAALGQRWEDVPLAAPEVAGESASSVAEVSVSVSTQSSSGSAEKGFWVGRGGIECVMARLEERP